ncbi:MAG: O-antigen ligase family protein, partial [Saprospiraceae bacterium]
NPQSPIPNPQSPIPNSQSPIPNSQFPIPNFWLVLGLYFSFCRAAWLSVVVAGLLGGLLIFWEHRRWLFSAVAVAMAVLVFQRDKIADPAADGNARDLAGQLRSLANFTTDASNLERLNRYSCALRMADDRPVLGFGPGTFQFQYLAYQRPEEMTRISVTQPITDRNSSNYGRGGGAHSEYLQALAEMGLPGFLLWVSLVAAGLGAGVWAFFSPENAASRWQMLAAVLSLTTFFVHGLVNNFLHDGRVAALFWGQMAMLAAVSFSEKYPATRPPNPGTET